MPGQALEMPKGYVPQSSLGKTLSPQVRQVPRPTMIQVARAAAVASPSCRCRNHLFAVEKAAHWSIAQVLKQTCLDFGIDSCFSFVSKSTSDLLTLSEGHLL